MAYKKLIKVSNVCQLLDKRTYPATSTANGVTWTNNGDGTITVNGTATKSSNIGTEIKNWTPIIGHKILVSGCPEGGGANTFSLGAFNQRGAIDYGNGAIGSVITTGKWFGIIFNSGVTFDNLIFKPQLFDLTEMYGAGHEPTTVEQFRQDFPDELYDYSPYCWLTSYKRVFMTGGGNYLTSYQRNLTCKTKNLLSFPYYSSYITKNGITFSQVETYKVHASGINTNSTGTAFDFVYGKTFKAGTYTIKFYTEGNTTKGIYYRLVKDSYYGTTIGDTLTSKLTFTLSVDTVLFIGFGIFGTGSSLFASEGVDVTVYCQLELGDTATDYVPYGHL